MKNDWVISYSQNREDIILAKFFEDVKRGFYVDVGANHPVEDSVTKYFYDKGWCGINIEPNTRLFSLLEKQRPRDVNLGVGVSNKIGRLKIREYEGWYAGLSTFSDKMKKENRGVAEYRDIEVAVVPLSAIFQEHKVKKINFLKVDVEGFEYNVLASNDWDKYRPEVICIEANHRYEDWRVLLKNANYELVFFDGLNEYYVANEAKQRKEMFSYIDGVIGKTIVNYSVSNEISSLEDRIEAQQAEINTHKSENLQLKRDIINLKRITPLVKQLVKSVDASIRARIEALNKIEAHKGKKVSVDIGGSTDVTKLLNAIRQYDIESYFSYSQKRDKPLYTALYRAYDLIFGALLFLGKNMIRVMKRFKK